MQELTYIIIWSIGLMIISFLNLPLTFLIFRQLPDKGVIFSKSLFLIFISFFVFLLAHLNLIHINILIIISLMASLMLNFLVFIKYREEILSFLRLKIKYIILVEISFIFIFCFIIFIQAHYVEIPTGEKMMNSMILNTIYNTDKLPPQDTWLSGNSLNYYYFTQFIGVVLMKLFYTPVKYGFILYFSFLFVATFFSFFSIIYSLTKKIWPAILGVFILFSGNYFIFFQGWAGIVNFDHMKATRFIDGIILDFPSYFFRLGNIHAHFNVIFIELLFIILLINYYRESKKNYLTLFLIGVTISIIALAHTWDLPIYAILFSLFFILKHKKLDKVIRNFSDFLIPAVIGSIIFFPFYFSEHMQVNGVVWGAHKTSITEYITHFGLFIFIFINLLLLKFKILFEYYNVILNKLISIKKDLYTILLVFLFIYFAVYFYMAFIRSPLSLLLSLLLISAIILIKVKIRELPLVFGLILFSISLLLSLFVENLYIDDVYWGYWDRYNTGLKFYNQAWFLFSLAASCFVFYIFNSYRHKSKLQTINFIIIVLFLVLACFYPLLIFANLPQANNLTINHYKYVDNLSPDDYQALLWVEKNIDKSSVFLTSPGPAYTLYNFLSSYTGIPVVLGSFDHEWVWRGFIPEIDKRIEDIDNIYIGVDVLNLLKKYNIKYIYVGKLEREKYEKNLYQFEDITETVYHNDMVDIYLFNK